MVKIEIDITEEINKVIEEEVGRQLDKGGLLRFVRTNINELFRRSGSATQIRRHEGFIREMKKKIENIENEIEKSKK